jgi:hypothetical protein
MCVATLERPLYCITGLETRGREEQIDADRVKFHLYGLQ